MNGESLFLNFGPVQEFLSEARRTRDLWAGSYLLSFLAGSAFCQAEKAGGKVILPYLSGNELYEAIRNHKEPNLYGKRVGSIPVMSEIYVPPEGKKSDEIADQACDKWIKAWKSIASTVWDYLKEKAGIDTDPNMFIRNRQIEDLWTCTWVQGQPEFMKRRKTLRSFKRRAEPGEKCTCCGTRQALSGEGEKRSDVRNFWAEIAAKYPRDLMQDGRERLCAVCTIKRFYPYVAKTAVGWETPKTFPSTVTMASLPWRRKVLERGVKDSELRQAAHDHIESLKKANAVTVGALRDFESLKELANQWPDGERQVAIELIEYDGDWFYPETINLEAKESNLDDNLRKNLIHSLEKLRNAAQTTTSIYYALLVMDGDRMGKLLSEHASQKEEISKVLGEFSQRVVEIVESSEVCGRVIYSGGDDVLAILP
jgi:CRISPR-associated protein Cmr2